MRPTKYEDSHCQVVIDAGKEGKSIAWMACELEVSVDSLYEWEKVYPQFSEALTQARLLSQRWWEDKGQEGMVTPGFSAPIWSRSMAARFPKDWRENKGVEVSGALQVETTTKEQRDAAVAAATLANS